MKTSEDRNRFYATASCVPKEVDLKIFEKTLVKIPIESFTSFVVFTDILVVIIVALFVEIIERRQNHFARKFETETIEIPDFSLTFRKLPKDHFSLGDEDLLRAKLWHQITKIMEQQYAKENGPDKVMDPVKYSIVDINFARKDNRKVEALFIMDECRRKVNALKDALTHS